MAVKGGQCGRCRGVLTAIDPGRYTLVRARLILTHGYCQCAGERADFTTAQAGAPAEAPAAVRHIRARPYASASRTAEPPRNGDGRAEGPEGQADRRAQGAGVAR
ncbi:hypothetical protein ACOZ38_22235 [Sphaerisporangium viridialbum]|uniref:hypothetical protein n=1 Tax=Sphaerisporangium viridialbum TaxID=46189 RepID=UPI003C7734AE